MSTAVTTQDVHDSFLSHSSADKPWVRGLFQALEAQGLRVFLDERDIQPGESFVLTLNDALRASRFLVLVATPRSAASQWVKAEWASFMAEHGPVDRIAVVLLESVELPTLLKSVQQIDATHQDAKRVAAELLAFTGRAGELKEGDARALLIGQDLVFVLRQEGDQLQITDPTGQTRQVAPPWKEDKRFGVAMLSFNQMTRQAITSDAERAELVGHARTLGELMFGLLFGTDTDRGLLQRAMIPGRPCPLVTIRSDDDLLLSLPWELLSDGGSFLVRDARLDVARCALGPAAPWAVLGEPKDYFKLVVNVSAPEGGGLDYEAESYRITRALSEHCQLVPTELGTVDDLVETVKQAGPTGIHFSGHGSPGQLQFEDEEGRAVSVPIRELIEHLRRRLPDGALPRLFYLASCHGNEPAAPEEGKSGSESSAALLHRAGVPQVIGYFGPIADELSTRAEEALYAAIAEGHTTRYAVRQARAALGGPFFDPAPKPRPAASPARDPGTGGAPSSHPFAWAQLVFYHRGPEHPLGRPIPAGAARRLEQTLRRTFVPGKGRILATGFIGRRTERHRIRKRLGRGDRVLVFQGLGGLGKTQLAFHTLPLLAAKEDRCTLWCQEAEKDASPAENLVGQLLEYCRARFGHQWEPVVQQVDRVARDDSALRFQTFLQALLQNVGRLVVYLDNMESLLVGPKEVVAPPQGPPGDDAFAAWRSEALRAIWLALCEAARDGDRLWVVASCRYRNPDFQQWTVPVSPLPAGALFRLMGWFEGLRRLAGPTRAKLVGRLAGHPRAVQFADDLIAAALARYEDLHGPWELPVPPAKADLEREWEELVEPALPKVQEELWDDLLLEEIWERVLDDGARRMLFRMTLLRRPWDWDLMAHLGEPDEAPETAEATVQRLRGTSLLEQMEVSVQVEKGRYGTVRRYTLHPATAQFIALRFGDDEPLRRQTHLRIGEHIEAVVGKSPYIETALEAGHHLFEAAEYDRAYKLLGTASEWLQQHGRVRKGLQVLKPFLAEAVRTGMDQGRVGRLLGTVGLSYHRLGQVEKAIGYYEQTRVIAREIGDRLGEGAALGNLGLAYARLGQVEKAIGYHEQGLVIDREIGDRRGEGADLGNLGLAYHRLGEVEKAIGYYQQGLVIDREIGDRRGEGAALGNLGSAYAALGQVEKAIALLEQALKIGEEIKDPEIIRITSAHLQRLREGPQG